MTIAYNFGGINLHYWFFHYMGDWSYRDAATVMSMPVEDWNFPGPRGAFTALGAAVMVGLTWLRHTFLWWPVHPIRFPIGGTQLFNKLRPLFLGMVLGEVIHQGLWMAIDYLTGSIGMVHRW